MEDFLFFTVNTYFQEKYFFIFKNFRNILSAYNSGMEKTSPLGADYLFGRQKLAK